MSFFVKSWHPGQVFQLKKLFIRFAITHKVAMKITFPRESKHSRWPQKTRKCNWTWMQLNLKKSSQFYLGLKIAQKSFFDLDCAPPIMWRDQTVDRYYTKGKLAGFNCLLHECHSAQCCLWQGSLPPPWHSCSPNAILNQELTKEAWTTTIGKCLNTKGKLNF